MRILKPLFVLLICILGIIPALADDVMLFVCRDADGVFHFGFEGDVIGWWFNDATSFDLQSRTTSDAGAEFVVYYNPGTTESIFASEDAPSCQQNQSDIWQPDAPSILIPADGAGPYLLEIQDAFGHWSLVTDTQHPEGIVLYNHAGTVELIGSVGQDHNPAHYRLIEMPF